MEKWRLLCYAGENIRVQAFYRAGYYFLRTSTFGRHTCATRRHGVYVTDTWWSVPVVKRFEQPEDANRYFKGIKKNHPDLALVRNIDRAYINGDGNIIKLEWDTAGVITGSEDLGSADSYRLWSGELA